MQNLIDVLDLEQDGRIYAKALSWLLDPAADHGLGDRLLRDLAECPLVSTRLARFLASEQESIRVDARRRRGRWDLILEFQPRGRLELIGGSADPDEFLDPAITCLLPPPGSDPSKESDLPGWSWDRILEVLERSEPAPHFAPFLSDLTDHLRERLRPATPAPPLLALDESRPGDSDRQMVLSEDMSRAYQINEQLGEGSQGLVFDVRVMGNRTFPTCPAEVRHAVLKLARGPKDDESILLEEAVYRTHGANLARFLDSGVAGERRYLVIERLYPLPNEWFSEGSAAVRLDLATAIDVFFALLQRLARLHFNKSQGLVLCDIKPENILLRLSTDGREIPTPQYQRLLAAGAYEPLFADVGCAQDREVLRESDGRINTLIGTPYYLAPESVRPGSEGGLQPGSYGPAADAYALSLTFYHYLTGVLPFAHRGLDRMSGEEALQTLLALKSDGADPLDRQLLYRLYDGAVAKDLEEVLDLGLHPDPEQRAGAHGLLNACRERFGFREVEASAEALELGIRGLEHSQTRFPRVSSGSDVYKRKARAATRRRQRIS